jgi:large subunit ribosomal protein L21
MYAIVEIGGHQYKVAENDVLFVDKQNSESDKLTFDRVLLVKDDSGVKIGTPVVEGAEVSATLLDTVKADKVLVFKKKRRKGYQKLNGHRQVMSQIQIDGIALGGSTKKKAAAKKTEEPKKEAAPKAESADLSSKTVAELKEMAKEQGLTGYSSMKKAELIEALS